MKHLVIAVVCLLGFSQAMADFPKNTLHLQDRRNFATDAEQKAKFEEIVNHVVALWQPLAQTHGANLAAELKWEDPTVNAYAEQNGNTWKVTMFGGLFRRPEVTLDGFAMVVCHELGHHFAGYYYWPNVPWAAAEGEADYFATHVCAQRIFAKTFNRSFRFNPNTGREVPAPVKIQCDKAWADPAAQDRCYRTAAAGYSLADLLATIGHDKKPTFENPDRSQVSKTRPEHPVAQCRLDTYMAGGLCAKPFDLSVIPGKVGMSGSNGPEAEAQAMNYSCPMATQIGYRPRCWFKPQIADTKWF